MSDNSKNRVEASNMIVGKKYFRSNDKDEFISVGIFTKKYFVDHYDGPRHSFGTERGYIFSIDDKQIKIRDDNSSMIFYEDKLI
jgi:hypothetical protein